MDKEKIRMRELSWSIKIPLWVMWFYILLVGLAFIGGMIDGLFILFG